MFRGTHGTNQNFIPRPGDADIDSTGCQDEPPPQTLNQLVTSAPLEYIDEGRNLGEHRKLRVSVSGTIRNQVARYGYSLSRATKGARRIFSRCLSSSSSVKGLPSNPRTRHLGAASRSRRSLAKCRIP